jgi:hypothetical protein
MVNDMLLSKGMFFSNVGNCQKKGDIYGVVLTRGFAVMVTNTGENPKYAIRCDIIPNNNVFFHLENSSNIPLVIRGALVGAAVAADVISFSIATELLNV